jgi:hypothetical protein
MDDMIRCSCGDTDGPFERQPDGSYRCEGCIKTGRAS